MNYEQALVIATSMHKGQKRKKTGEDYIVHPIAVANQFVTEDFKVIAVLHDIIEDTNLTLQMLKDLGLEGKLIYNIYLLTKKDNQSYLHYLLEIKTSSMAKLIKIEDLKHNLINPLTKCQEDKYKMALYILEN